MTLIHDGEGGILRPGFVKGNDPGGLCRPLRAGNGLARLGPCHESRSTHGGVVIVGSHPGRAAGFRSNAPSRRPWAWPS